MESDMNIRPEETPNVFSESASFGIDSITSATTPSYTSSNATFSLFSGQSSDTTGGTSNTSNMGDGASGSNAVPDFHSHLLPLLDHGSWLPIDFGQHPLPVSHLNNCTVNCEHCRRNSLNSNCGCSESYTRQQRHRESRRRRKHVLYQLGLRAHWYDERKLITAILNSDFPRVIEMLEGGANPNVFDQKQRTPLHIAASKGHDCLSSLLLSKGADPNHTDILGNTPLHLAVCRGDSTLIKNLIDNGANIFVKDNNGRTPLSIARSRLRTLRGNQNLPTDKMKSEFMLISYFLSVHASKRVPSHPHNPPPPPSPIDNLCEMMQKVSTKEQADEIADVMLKKMSDMTIQNIDEPKIPKPSQSKSESIHSIL